MLELLVEYARKHPEVETRPGFKPKYVRWAIACDAQGRFPDVLGPLGDTSAKRNPGQEFRHCPDLSPAEMNAGNTTKSQFLVETAAVVALYGNEASSKATQAKHAYFVGLLREASKTMPELMPAAQMLDDPNALAKIGAALKEAKVKPYEKVTLRVGDMFPVDSDCWHFWWQEFWRSLQGAPGRDSVCLVSGDIVKAKLTHPPIDWLSDVGATSPPVLAGFDKDAFLSYGLDQSENAAASEGAAYTYRGVLSHLLDKHSAMLAGAKVAHWYRDNVEPECDLLSWLEDPPAVQEMTAQQRAKELLDAIRVGRRPSLAGNRYYALTLSGTGGRVMVRDWMEGPFEDLVANIGCWFGDLLIQDIFGNDGKPPGIEHIITSLLPPRGARQEYDAWVRPIGSERFALWRAAVRRGPIPLNALGRLVLQNRSFTVTGTLEEALKGNEPKAKRDAVSLLQVRMGLMKAYHLRKTNTGGYLKPFLDEEHPSAAYHCGRLMAVMARLQRTVMPEVKTGVVQRYYAAASATPALVLGRLERLSKFHLGSLGKDKPGLAVWYDQTMASIHSRIDPRALPKALTLEEQSLFALGYYQQLAFRKSDDADAEEKTNE